MKHLTLEQCEKLKELGFPQDTYFWHYMAHRSIALGKYVPE